MNERQKPFIFECRGKSPLIHKTAFIAETAQIIGDVSIGKQSSVWHGAVLRGDIAPLIVGERSNIQDNCVFHGTSSYGVVVGNDVTIGHAVVLHGCQIGDKTLIGMGSCVMDEAMIPTNCIIGAGTLITPRTQFEPGHLILGRPGRMIRKLTEKELNYLEESAKNYILISSWYN